MNENYTSRFKTSLGSFKLAATTQGLYSLEMVKKKSGTNRKTAKAPFKINRILKQGVHQISQYLDGARFNFRNLPVDWTGYQGFEKKVLQELRRIPAGKTESYQFLAQKAGRPRASRYVGRILSLNRLPIILPCHRILRKNGALGGFSQGLWMKQCLLKLETPRVDKKLSSKRA